MQMNLVKDRIDHVEECADQARHALYGSSAPVELRQCVDEMHQQARQAQQTCMAALQQSAEAHRVRDAVEKLEQTGDRALQACRSAGSSVDPQLQQAVQRAHAEISNLKRQMQ